MSYTIIAKAEDVLTSTIGPNRLGKFYEVFVAEINGKNHTIAMEINGPRVSISDEGYWNPDSAVGEELSAIADVMRADGKVPGMVLTPYALTEFGGKVGYAEMFDQIDRTDFVAIDPYMLGIPGVTEEMLLDFTKKCIDYAHKVNKPIIMIIQGFAHPGLEQRVIDYNLKLAQFDFEALYVGDAIDFTDIPDEWMIDTSAATESFNSRKDAQEQESPSLFERIVAFFKRLLSKFF